MSVKNLAKGRNVLRAPIEVSRIHPNGEIPFKESEWDAGWELTAVSRCENRAEDVHQDVNTFSTGIIITPPKHYHIEIFAHPALYKAGYMLVGTPLVINPGNHEELILPLFKFREGEDLELPFRAALLILRETEYAVIGNDGTKRQRPDDEPEFIRPSSRPVPVKKGKGNHFF